MNKDKSPCSGPCSSVALLQKIQYLFNESNDKTNNLVQGVKDIIEEFHYDETCWTKYKFFNQYHFTRVLLALEKNFSAFLYCWEPGQQSPLHDFANSDCWMTIVEGELQATSFNSSKEPTKVCVLKPGHVSHFSTKTSSLQRLNNSSKARSVSLHIYSPPYVECFEGTLPPVIYCNSNNIKKHLKPCPEDELSVKFQCQKKIFSNFQELTEILKKEIGPKPDIPKIQKLIQQFQFNPREWKKYENFDAAHYTRNLVAYDENFTLIQLCWDKGQISPIHDHSGSSCWVKVLDGELTERLYNWPNDETAELQESSHSVCLPGSLAYIDDSLGVHSMGNESLENGCITLHCYAPPYSFCNKFDKCSGKKEKVSMSVVNQMDLPNEPDNYLTNIGTLVDVLNKEFAENENPLIITNETKEKVSKHMENFNFNPDEWQQCVHFDPHRYTRNLLAYNQNFSLIMNCWNVQQESPIHDHEESESWMKVLTGELDLTEYNQTGKNVTSVSQMLEGSVHHFNGRTALHKTGNSKTKETAISLHLYSPPYMDCCGSENTIPVVYCSSISDSKNQKNIPKVDLQLESQKMVFSNFDSLAQLLRQKFEETDNPCSVQLTKYLETLCFNPIEWSKYCNYDKLQYTRNMVAYDDKFLLTLFCWNPGQETGIQNNGGSCSYMKVLEGKIEETMYDSETQQDEAPKPMKKSILLEDSVVYNKANTVYKLANTSDSVTVTLMIFSPPNLASNFYAHNQ